MEYPEWEGTHEDHPVQLLPCTDVPKSHLVLAKYSWSSGRFWGPKSPQGSSRVGQSPPWTSSSSTPHRNDGGCRKCRATTRNFHDAPIPSLCQQNTVVEPRFHIFFGWGGRQELFSHKTLKFFHQHRLVHDLQPRKDNKAHVYHIPGPLSQSFPGSFPGPSCFKSWAQPARNSKEQHIQISLEPHSVGRINPINHRVPNPWGSAARCPRWALVGAVGPWPGCAGSPAGAAWLCCRAGPPR